MSSDAVLKTWPQWDGSVDEKMVNLNETGGTPYQQATSFGATVTQFAEPGLENSFSVVDAFEWEAERGKRCEFWKSVADKIFI